MYRSYSKALLYLISTLAFILTGCSGSNSDGTIKIGKIDISGAKVLMVSPESSVINKAGSSNTNVFVKIKDNGTVETVTVTDVDGNVVDVIPSKIYDATDAYVIIIVEDNPYLVAKADGSTYDLSPVGQPEMLGANFGYDDEVRKSIYSDSNGNIYYLSGGIVKKIDVSNQESITAQNYTPDIYYIHDEFAVDADGNVIFSYNIDFVHYAKFKKNNGSLCEVSNPIYLCYTGFDGNLYYQPSAVSQNTASGVIQKITFDSELNITYSDYGTLTVPGYAYGQAYRWMYFGDRIVIIQDTSKTEIYKTAGVPSTKTLSFLSSTSLKMIKCSSNYYYVATKQGAILKVDPADDSYDTLINNDQYDYYKMTVTSDDMVIFYALRLSDAKKVIGQISSVGTVSIIDETLDDDVLILEKIN